jgi:nicotinamidase-related amidase
MEQQTMSGAEILAGSEPFMTWLAGWWDRLPVVGLGDVVRDPARTAAISIDLVNGFCYEGPLSGPRVAGIVPATVRLFHALHDAGVTRFVLTQDTHDPDAPEFAEWGPHCVRGTAESQTIPALRDLPFAHLLQIMEKNSTSSAHATGFDAWLDDPAQAGVDTFVAVGDCTDLCIYQLAMHVKLRANAQGRRVRVVLPENCIQTYDMPVAVATELGLPAHDGNFLHLVFLYHMALNGCEVVRRIDTAPVPA